MRKPVVFFLLFLLIGAGAVVFFRMKREADRFRTIRTASSFVATLLDTVTLSGKTKALRTVKLTFRAAGTLAWIGVSEGNRVEAGQIVATQDKRELERNLQKALRDYSKERNDFEEDRLLTYKDRVLTDTITRILEKNQWDLEKSVMDVELKSIALEWSTLSSPIGGIVTRVDTPVSGVSVITTDAIEIVDPQSIVFSGDVDEVDIGKILPGQRAQITLDASPDATYSAFLTTISFTAKTSSSGSTVFPVDMQFADHSLLRIGMNGDATISVREIPNVVIVPFDAVREDEMTRYVLVPSSYRTFLKKRIITGIETDTDVEIRRGIRSGESVVISGFDAIPPNTPYADETE